MKNKALKNLISFGALVLLFVSFNHVFAYVDYGPSFGYSTPSYQVQTQNQPSYGYTDPYYYVQPSPQYASQPQAPQIQYVQLPTQYKYVQQPVAQTEVKYVQPQQTIQYVNQPATPVSYVNTQGASALQIQYAPQTTKVVATTKGTTGQYVSYEAGNPNLMGASAYGSYYGQPVQQVVRDNNGLTALSVNGSGSFMPSSVFQWFIVILLILGIIILARMVSKSFSKNDHAVPAH